MDQPTDRARVADRLTAHLPALLLLAVAVPVPFDLGLLVLAGFGVLSLLDGRRPRGGWHVLDSLVLLVGIAYLAVAALGLDPLRSLVLGYPVLMGLVAYAVLSRNAPGARSQRRSLISLAIVSVILSAWVLAAAPLGTAPQQRIDAASNLLFVVPNDALLVAVLAAVCLPLLHQTRPLLRGLALATWMLAFLVGFVLQSRGVLLVLLVALVGRAVWVGRQQPKVAVGLCAGIVLLVGLVLGIELAVQGPFTSKFIGWWDGRIPLWHAAWAQFAASPMVGHGPGSFGVLHDPAADLFTAVVDRRISPWPHNLILEWLAGGGLLLAIPFVALWVQALRLALRDTAPDTGARSAWLLGLFVLGAAALFEASLLRFWFTLSFFSLLGFLNALERRHTVVSNDRSSHHGHHPRRSGHPPRHLRT